MNKKMSLFCALSQILYKIHLEELRHVAILPEFEVVKKLDEVIKSDREIEYIEKVPVPIESVTAEIAVELETEVKSDDWVVHMEGSFALINPIVFDSNEDVSLRDDTAIKLEVRVEIPDLKQNIVFYP